MIRLATICRAMPLTEVLYDSICSSVGLLCSRKQGGKRRMREVFIGIIQEACWVVWQTIPYRDHCEASEITQTSCLRGHFPLLQERPRESVELLLLF
jgi:hypothetical protein